MKPVRAVLFDMDGVLVDTEQLLWEASLFVVRKRKLSITYEDFVQKTILQGRSIFADADFSALEISALRKERDRHYLELLQTQDILIPHARELLDMLVHKGIRSGLGTSSGKSSVKVIMDRFGLEKYFAGIVTRDDVEHIKPHPDVYLQLCRKLNVSVSDCIVIEDSDKGVMAARNGGFQVFVATNSRYGDVYRYDGAGKIFPNILEMKNYLFQLDPVI